MKPCTQGLPRSMVHTCTTRSRGLGTLVLVHAGIADLRMWDGPFARFAQRYRTVRWDMRGFGSDADDPEILRGSDLLAKEIRGSRNVIMPETAHLPSMERPGEFNEHVLEFLADLS